MLEAGSAALRTGGPGKAHRADPPRGSGAAAQHLLHQRRCSGPGPDRLGGDGLPVRDAGRALCGLTF